MLNKRADKLELLRIAEAVALEKSIPKNLLADLKDEEFYVNPTGQFIIGGPDGDLSLIHI